MNTRTIALALALSGAALPALAQQTTPAAPRQGAPHAHRQHGARGERRGSPIAMLIARRQQLALTDAQVQRLQAVEQRVQAQQQPLMAQLRSLRPDSARRAQMTEQQRQALRAQAEPIRKQLREQRQAAFRDVQSILTDQQKQQVRQAMRQHGKGRRAGFRHGRHGARGQHQFAGSPAARLIARQQELGLSADQVSRLNAIDAQVKAKNDPIVAQLRSFMPDSATRQQLRAGQLSDAQKQALKARREQARPLMQQLRENGKAAAQQVRSVLTQEQQTKLRQMHHNRRGGERHGRRGQRPAQPQS